MRLREFALAGAMMAMLAGPTAAQTTQTTPQTPRTSIPPTGNALPGAGSKPTVAPAQPSTMSAPAHQSATTPININTATAAELDALPGIGKARAAKIIQNRPYKSVDELQSKHVIPQNVYNKIKNDITARPA